MNPITQFLKESEEKFEKEFGFEAYDETYIEPRKFLRQSHLELLEVVEGTAKKVMKDVKVLGDVTGLWKHGYNQALSDFLDLIREEKSCPNAPHPNDSPDEVHGNQYEK